MISRRGSADIEAFGGVQTPAPVLSGVLLLAGLSVLGLPGMSTFVSEFMVLAGSWGRGPILTAVASLGMVLSAVYVMRMYQRTMTGPETATSAESFRGRDLTGVEKLVMVPIIGVLLFLGFVPQPAVGLVEPTATAALEYVGQTDPAPQAVKGVK
jgi:NADH-quinone oxidoreductase subunit M